MHPPNEPLSASHRSASPDGRLPEGWPSEVELDELDQLLLTVERSLVALKERHSQVRRDRQHQAELQQRLQQTQAEWHRTHVPQLRAELHQIEKELDTLEVALESQLLTWGSFREVFWQAVRFGGLGVVVGWILKSCAG